MIAQYSNIFRWHVLRHLRQHPLLATLNILSVALGVAVFLAIQIANQSANRAFAATVDMVAGKADLEVTTPSGAIPDTAFPTVQSSDGIAAATPLIRGLVIIPDFPGEYLEILGIDIFTNSPFRIFEPQDFDFETFDIERWLAGPATIAVTEEFLTTHKLKQGDTVRARVGVDDHELKIKFVLRSEGHFDSHFAAMDIGWAQELLGRRGELDAIQLRLSDRAHRESIIEDLRKRLPKDAIVAPPARRTEEVNNMLSGFELNLAAMSLLSLIVGMFLIYNTVSASVVRRQREIGILRSLGMRRVEVRALFLLEALVLGAIGCFLGLAGGLVLARVLMEPVTETISSLYVLVSVRRVALDSRTFVSAWTIGMAAVAVSAWFPARAAARMEPLRALSGGAMLEKSINPPRTWRWAAILSLLLATTFSLLAISTGPPWLGFAAAFLVLAGWSSLVPLSIRYFSLGAGKFLQVIRCYGKKAIIEAEVGAANLSRALVRNSVTIAALAAAIAMTVGVSVMVFSFRQTVGRWINSTLIADLFVAPASNEIVGTAAFVSPAALEFLRNHPAVEAVDVFRELEVPMGEETVAIAVLSGARRRFQFVVGNEKEAMENFRTKPCVFVSESFARRHRVQTGEAIELSTPEAIQRFPIAGVVYDYSRDQGVVYMSQRNFVQFWHDDRVNSAAVYLRNDQPSEELTQAFRKKFSGSDQYAIYSNRSLRNRVFEIFDQTFAVTYVLRLIAVCVAITGVFLSLTMLITERSRELAIIRAIGGSSGQIRRLLLWETAMLGGIAAVVGVVSGICLSLVLTGVINRAFFGWTIQLAFPWRSLVFTPFWIFAAALIAGMLPAWRAGRMALAESLRSE